MIQQMKEAFFDFARKKILLFSCFIVLAACQHQPEVISTPQIIEQTRIVIVTATPQPTVETTPTTEVITLSPVYVDHDPIYPNLWTQISSEKITNYFFDDSVYDYAYDQDGSIWVAGGFGILHRKLDGQITHYSIASGLPINTYTRIILAPDGQIWAGGFSQLVIRFDGEQWIEESLYFSEPYDDRTFDGLGRDQIVDIDFDYQGNPWVLTGNFDIFTKQSGQWVSLNFPKHYWPVTASETKALGIQASSLSDYLVKGTACCAIPWLVYTYDGESWTRENGLYGDQDPIPTHSDPEIIETEEWFVEWLKTSLSASSSELPSVLVSERENCILMRDFINHQCQFSNSVALDMDEGWQKSSNELKKDGLSTYRLQDVLNDISLVKEIDDKTIFIGADTSLGLIQDTKVKLWVISVQNQKPHIVLPGHSEFQCLYNSRYDTYGICLLFNDAFDPIEYSARLLHIKEDGSILYANNHILAEYKDGVWRSFYFDLLEIEDIAVDEDGYIWLYLISQGEVNFFNLPRRINIISTAQGIIRLAPDIFEDYQDVSSMRNLSIDD